MREAGFTESEVSRWEKSSTHASKTLLDGEQREGNVDSVRWKGRGETREWDRGKEIPNESDDADEVDGEDRGGRLSPVGGFDGVDESLVETKTISKIKEKRMKASGDEAWARPKNGLLKQFQKALG
jgi:hypothetical protein